MHFTGNQSSWPLNHFLVSPSLEMHFGVIGSGVVGLCTALQLQEDYRNAKVTIVADKFGKDTTRLRIYIIARFDCHLKDNFVFQLCCRGNLPTGHEFLRP